MIGRAALTVSLLVVAVGATAAETARSGRSSAACRSCTAAKTESSSGNGGLFRAGCQRIPAAPSRVCIPRPGQPGFD